MNVSEQTKQVLAANVRQAEDLIEQTVASIATLTAGFVAARRESGATAMAGHATLLRLAETQLGVVRNGSNVLRIHGDLVDLHREHCGGDTEPYCPEERFFTSGKDDSPLRAVKAA